MTSRSSPTEAHVEVIELLPWFVNGTLTDDERTAVERHVSSCLPCRKALKEELRLRALVADDALSPLSPRHGLDRLLSEIDAADARDRPGHRETTPRWRDARGLGLAVAASLAIAVVGVWTVLSIDRPPPAGGDFSTLTGPAAGGAARIDVVFAAGLTAADREAVLGEIHGTIVEGPSDVGRYTIEIEGGSASEADVEQILARLRQDDRVRLASRWFGAGDAE